MCRNVVESVLTQVEASIQCRCSDMGFEHGNKGLPMTREMQIAVERAARAAQTDPLVEALAALQSLLDQVDDHHYRDDDESVALAADHARYILAEYAPDKKGGAD